MRWKIVVGASKFRIVSDENFADNDYHGDYGEILTDIAMWPANLTENMRNYVLDFKPKNLGDLSRAGILMRDRGREYFRHVSENNLD